MKEPTAILPIVLWGLTLATGSAWASPIVLVDTLGPGNSFQTSRGNAYGVVGSSNPHATRAPAVQFTPEVSAYLNTISVAVGQGAASREFDFGIELLTDVNGQPGSVLESWDDLVPNYGANASGDPVTVTDTLGLWLNAGTNYWLQISPAVTGNHGTSDIWNYNNQGFILNVISGGQGMNGRVNSATAPAFKITGTTPYVAPLAPAAAAGTPEPASLMMTGIGSGLLGLAAFLRKLRK